MSVHRDSFNIVRTYLGSILGSKTASVALLDEFTSLMILPSRKHPIYPSTDHWRSITADLLMVQAARLVGLWDSA